MNIFNLFKSCTSFNKLSNKTKEEIHIKRIKILPEYKRLVHLRYLEKIQQNTTII
jgi:hypothetical protein